MRLCAGLAVVVILLFSLTACTSLNEDESGNATPVPATWSPGKAVAVVASVVRTPEREPVSREANATYNSKQGFWEVSWEITSQGRAQRATWRVYEKNSTVVPWDDLAKTITPLLAST